MTTAAVPPPKPDDRGTPSGVEAAGGIAAPLLAGIAFALVALVLQLRSHEVRWRDATLALLVASGLSQIAAVQASMWSKQYADLPAGTRWATFMSRAYDVGIICLLAAVTALLAPPGRLKNVPIGRWIPFAIAALGLLGECVWVAYAIRIECRGRRRLRAALKLQPRDDG